MKKFSVLFLFVLIASLCFAQSNCQDVVHLKNGSIIRGVIIEQIPNESIKIETADGNIFVFQIDDVAMLSKDLKNWGLKDGYRGVLDVGYQIGTGNGINRLKIDFINGKQIGPYVSAGIGVGMRHYADYKVLLMPIFLNMKANFTAEKVTPYLSASLGYSFAASNNFKGTGVLFNPTVGVSFIFNNYSLNIGLGYELQAMNSSFYSDMGNIYGSNGDALTLSIGMSF